MECSGGGNQYFGIIPKVGVPDSFSKKNNPRKTNIPQPKHPNLAKSMSLDSSTSNLNNDIVHIDAQTDNLDSHTGCIGSQINFTDTYKQASSQKKK